jgi:uncharacterized protein (DUF1501 family)
MWSEFAMPSRRHFLKHVAGLSALAVPGIGFMQSLRAAAPDLKKKHKSLIVLWMGGGPSTIDLWDLKPGSPNAGQFKPIKTSVSGIEIGEHLPAVAKQMKHLAIVRSLETTEGDHNRGTTLMNTGRSPNPLTQYPHIGSVASQQLAPKDMALPAFVSIGGTAGRIGPGFLGMTYAPFTVQNPGQPPENMSVPKDVNLMRRAEMFKTLETDFTKSHGKSAEAAKNHSDIYDKAFSLVAGPASQAFKLDNKPGDMERYGNNNFGKGCMLAKKLTEQGSVCVEVDLGGWDNHQNIFQALHTTQGTGRVDTLDRGMAALVEDLVKEGRWQDTVVVWMGEFGRTPKINQNGGRDHWARCWSVVLGGGAIKGGQVYGETDKDGSSVKDNPVKIGELYATIYKGLGIDPNTQVRDNLGRPLAIAGDNVKPVSTLIG